MAGDTTISRPNHGIQPTARGGIRQWRPVIEQTARDLWASNALEWAATLAFYTVLSLFPLLLVGMILASFVADAGWATTRTTELLGEFLPRGQAEIEGIVTAAIDDRGRAGLVSVVVLMITGRRILGALTKGLDLVSDVDEVEDPLRRRVVVEAGLLTGLVGLVLLAFAIHPLLDAARVSLRKLAGPDAVILDIVQKIVRTVLLSANFLLLYVFVPRGERLWRAAIPGAVVATALFLVASAVFRIVIGLLWSGFSLVYGPLALAAFLLTWAWWVALVTLVGGAVASHVKVMVIEE